MESFDIILVKNSKTGEVKDITELDRKTYEEFLDRTNKMRVAYMALTNRDKYKWDIDTSTTLEERKNDPLLSTLTEHPTYEDFTQEKIEEILEWLSSEEKIPLKDKQLITNVMAGCKPKKPVKPKK